MGSVLLLSFLLFFSVSSATLASDGDADPLFRSCVKRCEQTGCVDGTCFKACETPSKSASLNAAWFMQEPLYLRWKESDCKSDCHYHCMIDREIERERSGQKPVKYYGKWPLKRVFGLQEPLSVAFSVINLALQFHGWLSFLILVYYKLPLRPETRNTYYDFTGLSIIYGILSMNYSLWSSFFHSRDVDFTERLDYSSAVALVGFSLIVSILRTFSVTDEAARVMVAAPLIAFVTTHILYLNFYELDHGLNMKVCLVMLIIQLLLWTAWAKFTSHPSKYKIWMVVAGILLALPLEIYDFPPFGGYLDSQAIWHGMSIPLTYLWWSFLKEDAVFKTKKIITRSRGKAQSKKAQ
eukprot:TRINITY_DN4048_c0_g1_i1.p1 TRINITY_DN4048_c0_g1~~TRINITY_DN4048_c0_g1_i1.p1  ORF type:complete len:352 (-),score=53.60 TRINITY_DN4048_c0_g1_i1:352-1407(-)